MNARVQIISQLDSLSLDEELFKIFLGKLKQALRFVSPSKLEKYRHEIDSSLRLLYYYNTILIDVPSPGNLFQNLKYRDNTRRSQKGTFGNETINMSKLQKMMYLFFDVIIRYLWNKARSLVTHWNWSGTQPDDWRYKTWRVMNSCENLVRILDALNFLAFLYNARYRSMVDRICRTGLVYRDLQAVRTLSFEFLDRQLVWNGFTEFLLFMWPVITSSKLYSMLRSLLKRLHQGMSDKFPGKNKKSPVETLEWACALCKAEFANMPHAGNTCGHVVCYTCGAVSIEANGSYVCGKCEQTVESIERCEIKR